MRFQFQKNDFARRVEGVSGGNGGEDEAEGSPGGNDLRPGQRGAGHHAGTEGKERERNMSARVAVKAAGDIPEREGERESGEQEGRANEPAMLVKPDRIEQERVVRQMKEDAGDGEQGHQGRGDRLGVELEVTRNSATPRRT